MLERVARVVLVRGLLVGACRGAAFAQEAFVAGSAGVALGDGTSAAFDVSAGYVFTAPFGLEIEYGGRPDVDIESPRLPTNAFPGFTTFPGLPTVFLGIQVDTSAHLQWFHTSALVPVVRRGRMRLSIVGGGGVATLSKRIHVHSDAIVLPSPFPGFPGLTIPAIDKTSAASSTALSLQAGGVADFIVSRHAAVGAEARYQHAFISGHPLNVGRIAARVCWRF